MNIMMDLHDAAKAMNGTPVGDNVAFASVSTDSRAVSAEQLFVALRGEKFDGHAFVALAMERGAVAGRCAVVTVEDHERAFFLAGVAQGLEHAAHDFIEEGNHRRALAAFFGSDFGKGFFQCPSDSVWNMIDSITPA